LFELQLGGRPRRGYLYPYNRLNYSELAAWCRSRPGQVIVCEEEGADWLPFRPLALNYRRHKRCGRNDIRYHEMIWEKTLMYEAEDAEHKL
jgi:hypothetical protein